MSQRADSARREMSRGEEERGDRVFLHSENSSVFPSEFLSGECNEQESDTDGAGWCASGIKPFPGIYSLAYDASSYTV